MANQEQLDMLLEQGVESWNQWRQRHSDTIPDLSEARLRLAYSSGVYIGATFRGVDLSGAKLRSASLSDTDLSEANLSGANLSKASLSRADLSRADLSGANLSEANLSEANLTDADLSGAFLYKAILSGVTLTGANLSGANLSKASLWETNLSEINLSKVTLINANLRRANLSGANLSKASLTDADLREADLREADLSKATLSKANLSSANLRRATLTEAVLVETNLTRATLTQCFVYGISVWAVQMEGTKQDSLVITREGEPTIKVDNLEVAQFIYLLLNYKKLRDILNAVTERGVLILGRFDGGGLDVLQAIAAKLREENYLPIIFDFERPQDRDFTETVKTLAGLSRFVIVDLSGSSVPQELSHTVPFFDIPFVPIIEKGRRSYSIFVDLFKYPWVLRPPIEFATVEELLVRMPAEVIAPAEEKHRARQKLLDEIFKEKKA